jgi:serine/threonine protein kinase/Tol biopolymer transport system component
MRHSAVYSTPPVTIRLGSRLGPYEIASRVGAGGMGEVWRARDTRLGRDVAVKVLPESLAADPDRLRRFEQEARAAGSLNHPNLIAVYDVGADESTPYLVMELLEGETLREKIDEIPGEGGVRIPIRKALDYAGQMAEGLAAAHQRGIVHRDLKPDNVFVTNDGRVKILDFGLAKLAGRGSEGDDDRTREKDTSPGTVLGTVGYMSPEQVRGQPADHRSDIFSYGAILYEMLSGTRAFHGQSSADTMSAILQKDPPELTSASVPVSPALDRIVHRCLEKSRDERFDSAHDIAFALEAISGSTTSATGLAAIEPARRPLDWRHLTLAAALLLAIAAAALMAMRGSTRRAATAASPRLTQLTFASGVEMFPSLSPDGSSFVYSALTSGQNFDIYLQRVGGENAINLTADSPGPDIQAAFSPDGQSIAFRSLDRKSGGIYVMGATGEGRRRLGDFGFNPAWTPDGKALIVSTESTIGPTARASTAQLWRVDATSGRRTIIETGGDAVQPSVSPNGKRIAFWGLPEGTGKRILYTVPMGGGPRVALHDDDFFNWNPIWSRDGGTLYFVSSRGGPMNLWRIPIDEDSGKPLGPIEPVTTSASALAHPSLAQSGAMVFTVGTMSTTVERIPMDGALKPGAPTMLLQGSRDLWQADPSPDGEWLTLKSFDVQEDLLVVKRDGSSMRRLTNDRFKDRNPAWSADSTQIYFFSDRSGRYEIWRIDRDGGNLEQITQTKGGENPAANVVSRDGRRIASFYATGDPKRTAGLIDLSRPIAQRDPQWLPPIDATTGFFVVSWSPDDSRILGTGLRAGSPHGVWVYDVAGRTYERISDENAGAHGWIDAKTVLLSPDENVYAVDVASKARRPVMKVSGDTETIVVSRDGRSLYMLRRNQERDVWMLRDDAPAPQQR